MKKYFITLILSVLFCGNMFSQDQLNLPHISINSPSSINASCEGGDFEVSLGYPSQFINHEDLLIELINDKLGGAYNITVMLGIYSMGQQKFIFRISQNGYDNTNVILNGGYGGSMVLNQAACIPSPITGDVSYGTNWIIKTAYKSTDTTQFNRNITYYDAFGAPEQAIQVKASPNHKNIVQPVVYDNMRRSDAKTYLPYAAAGSGAYKVNNILTAQKTFYQNKFNAEDSNYAYIEKVYEPARPVSKQYNVGSIYRDQNKYTSYEYQTNTANEVFMLNVNTANNSLSVAGYYAAGSLYKNSVTDEDGIKVTTYTDKSGNTILTRAKDNSNQNVDTYYAYDVKGQLRWTLSPEGSALLANGNTYAATSDLAKKYCYTYKYDGCGNVIERQLPGKEAEYMVYDKGGRLVMFQDGVMRTSNQWIYNVYDDVNSLTDKSLVQTAKTRAQIQALYYAANYSNSYASLVQSRSIYSPFYDSGNFTTLHLISSTRYSGKKYYVRNELAAGIYLKVNTSVIPSADNKFVVSPFSETQDETISSIDINGNVIEKAVPREVLINDGGLGGGSGGGGSGGGSGGGGSDDGSGGGSGGGGSGGGSGGGGSDDGSGGGSGGGNGYLPIEPLPPDPVLKPDSVCDPTHLYINSTFHVKSEHLYYTDPLFSNIKYYHIPSEYMSIAECLAANFRAYNIFEGVPGGIQTAVWQNPSSLAFAPVAGVCETGDRETANVKNMKAYETVKILTPNGDFVERAFYYDKYGRLIQTVEKNHLGQISRYSVKYDFAGNVLAQHESHKTNTNTTDTRLTTFTYDHRGRMLTETTTINGDANSVATVSYQYDELGNPVKKILGNNAITETKTYNIQGQLTRKQAKAGADNIFDLQMKYHDATKATKSYAGNITELTWQHENLASNTYAYTYDKLKRLTSSARYEGASATPLNTFTEQGITYDRNGNILTLKRYGATALDSDLAYNYNGNKLVSLTGLGTDYAYDANGSMTHDGRRGFDVEYNLIDLIYRIKENSALKATYTYLADGTKLGVENTENKGFDYLGSFVYEKENNARNFESTAFAGGRIQKTNTGYEITYFITDHLGSTRVVVSQSGTVLGTNDYYTFGKRWEGANLQAPTTRYLFSGKEKQTTAEINYMDFGSRMYDDFLGRWFTIDPLAEEYYPLSPYAYCGNNPVNMIDPDGRGFFSSLWGAVSGFWKGIFNLKAKGKNFFEKIWNGVKDVAKSTWDGFRNSVKIDWGLFKGNPHQIFSRFTWELPQTVIGNEWSHIRNLTWQVDKVRYFDGATYVINANSKYRMGVTLGSYINIDIRESYDRNKYEPDGKFTVINDPLFMHEYGHYLQSQDLGWGYLFEVGIPSLFSAKNSRENYAYREYSWGGKRYLSSHDVYRKEMAANKKAAYYFYVNYGVVWSGDYFIEYPLNLDDVTFIY